MRNKRRLAEWPDDLQAVVARLAKECGNYSATPERLVAATGNLLAAVVDHEVIFSHQPKGLTLRQKALFKITIEGSRTCGHWIFTPGELVSLVVEMQDKASDGL